MNDLQTIARPYAKALFELALTQQALDAWSEVLNVLSITVEDPKMQVMLNHPEVTSRMLVDICASVLSKMSPLSHQVNLIDNVLEMMASLHRLPIFPEVFKQFEQLKAFEAKTCTGMVYTASELDEIQITKLLNGLEKKLKKTVYLSQVVQPDLLGGAKIQIGDMVIDGTIRGRLQRLSQSLLAAS